MNKKLILDIGNTQTKFSVFENDDIVEFALCSDEELVGRIKETNFENVIISSVRNQGFTEEVSSFFSKCLLLDSSTPIPIINKYGTPKTLGNDRIANAVGAWSLHPNQNNLIIDVGTCLKFDFVNADNQYMGGSISPGIRMRFNALHTFTDNLPLIDEVKSNDFIGGSTNESIQAGVVDGIIAEIKGIIDRYDNLYDNLQIVLTGGDSESVINLAKFQKNSIFADKLITLKGLNEILKYND